MSLARLRQQGDLLRCDKLMIGGGSAMDLIDTILQNPVFADAAQWPVLEVFGAVVLTVLVPILLIWAIGIKMTIPSPRLLSDAEEHEEIKQRKTALDAELAQFGFEPLGTYDFKTISNQETQARLYFNPETHTDLVLLLTIAPNIRLVIVFDVSTALSPNGELNTSTNKSPNMWVKPPDHIDLKMPWVKSATELYKHHLEHLAMVAREGFKPKPVLAENLPNRIVESMRNEMENQLVQKRMRKVGPDTYRITLWGCFVGVPKQMIPGIKLFVGHRSAEKRKRIIHEVATRARKLSEQKRYVAKD